MIYFNVLRKGADGKYREPLGAGYKVRLDARKSIDSLVMDGYDCAAMHKHYGVPFEHWGIFKSVLRSEPIQLYSTLNPTIYGNPRCKQES